MMIAEEIVDRAIVDQIREESRKEIKHCHICRRAEATFEKFDIEFDTHKVTTNMPICNNCRENIRNKVDEADTPDVIPVQISKCPENEDGHVWVWDSTHKEYYCDKCAIWHNDQE